ncbi:acyl-CoA reductase, partial [Myxococcota bacterium]
QGDCPRQYAVIRLVPRSSDAPEVVMAYGMEKVAEDLGIPRLSDTAFEGLRLDLPRLCRLLEQAVAEQVPVLLTAGTFTMVNVCDALAAAGRLFELPAGSTVLDAGGFKNRSRWVTVPEYERLVRERFGPVRCVNLFGMTELASQLYDAGPEPVGPSGQRVKAGNAWTWPTVRDSRTLEVSEGGFGLLEVTDLAIIDRPCVVLADDVALGTPGGAVVLGRAKGAPTRGCTLHLEEMVGGTT